MFKYIVMICSLVCFLSASPLWAAEALVGNYISDDFANLQAVIKNDANFRINLLEEDESDDVFMLMLDGKRWLVGRDNDESNWEALAFDELVQFVQEMDGALLDVTEKAVITKLGKQTVAGIAGESFNVKYSDESFNMVLTENADVIALTKAVFTFVKDISEDNMAMIMKAMEQIGKENNKVYGLLQCDDALVFMGLKRGDYPSSYFALPKNVDILDINNMFEGE